MFSRTGAGAWDAGPHEARGCSPPLPRLVLKAGHPLANCALTARVP